MYVYIYLYKHLYVYIYACEFTIMTIFSICRKANFLSLRTQHSAPLSECARQKI